MDAHAEKADAEAADLRGKLATARQELQSARVALADSNQLERAERAEAELEKAKDKAKAAEAEATQVRRFSQNWQMHRLLGFLLLGPGRDGGAVAVAVTCSSAGALYTCTVHMRAPHTGPCNSERRCVESKGGRCADGDQGRP